MEMKSVRLPREDIEGYYIVLISLHGLLRGRDLELGRDADTGGQIKYVVELATALGEHPKVARVDLLTRRIFDSRIDAIYSSPYEELTAKAGIVRIEFGPRRYLRKEKLWPYLEVFTDNTLKYLRELRRTPDLIHGHYADAGYAGSRLSATLGAPFFFSGHSLGRPKKRSLIEDGMKTPAIEGDFHIGRRIEAEENALENASRVIASTRQEVEEQYGMYDHYQPRRMLVRPPGVDLKRFTPPSRMNWGHTRPAIHDSIEKFLKYPKKPMILAMSRPVRKKNLPTLIKAYGESEKLRSLANMVIVAGSRDDLRSMDKASRETLTQVLYLIDYYDLYGSVAIPKQHLPEDVPYIYQMVARSRGVLVNPALTEPFGLTLIEAAASGLPVVATNDGGPKEIVEQCRNGLLVDPLNAGEMGTAILAAISDRARWKKWSKAGVSGANRNYSWKSHANAYVKTVDKVVLGSAKKRSKKISNRLVSHDRMLVCDIDNTLTGDREGLNALLERLYNSESSVAFGVATGRSLELTLKGLKEWRIPTPNLLITSVGSEIFYGENLVEDAGWKRLISHRWRPDLVRRTMEDIPGVKLQPPVGQGSHKISYFYDIAFAPGVREIVRRLRKNKLSVNVVYSHGMYIDILPVRASKGLALRYLADKWSIPMERCLVAGDSGNDVEMLTGSTLGVVVGNHTREMNSLKGRPGVYFADAHFAWGIIEGLDHYRFFDEPIEGKGE